MASRMTADQFAEILVSEIYRVMKEMGGWSLEYVLEMGMVQFNIIRNEIRKEYEAKRSQMNEIPKTIG